MKNINIRKLVYIARKDVFTTNNLVIGVALLIAIGWAWGSIGVLERNYALQRTIYDKEQQLKLVELETETLKYQQNYYKSDEYKELAARQRLGLVFPGEKVLIMPPNSAAAKSSDRQVTVEAQPKVVEQSNFQQWLNFLLGGTAQSLR